MHPASQACSSTQVDKLPPKIKEHAESRRDTALKDSWLEGEKSDLLGFVDFGHLAQIIIAKWDIFKDVIPTQHWLKQRMDDLEKCRNFIAHNRMLLPQRISTHIHVYFRLEPRYRPLNVYRQIDR